MKDADKIRKRIHQIRLHRGYSQEFMSIELDTSLRQYQRLEHGEKDWTLLEICKICEILDVPIHLLVNAKIDLIVDLDRQDKSSKSIMKQLREIKEIIRELRNERGQKKPSTED